MRNRAPSPEPRGRVERVPHGLSATLTAVKSASDRGRAESIRDVVDAFRRLYGSVLRFVGMFADDQVNFASVGTSGSHSLNQLLSILGEQAKLAGFNRLRDLKAVIEEARRAEQLRDAIFSDAFSNDPAALRNVVVELERLDAAFVRLCVGHVLEQHARAGGAFLAGPVTAATDRRRPAKGLATSRKTRTVAGTTADLVSSSD